jgi:hypothetical protein
MMCLASTTVMMPSNTNWRLSLGSMKKVCAIGAGSVPTIDGVSNCFNYLRPGEQGTCEASGFDEDVVELVLLLLGGKEGMRIPQSENWVVDGSP